MSMEEWLDGFRRDANPKSEVRWWERLTRWYRGYSDTRDLSAEQKKALFNVVFRLGMGLDDSRWSRTWRNYPQARWRR